MKSNYVLRWLLFMFASVLFFSIGIILLFVGSGVFDNYDSFNIKIFGLGIASTLLGLILFGESIVNRVFYIMRKKRERTGKQSN